MTSQTTMKHHAAKGTDAQLSYIDGLARRAGYRYTDQAVKDCLGKRPVGGLNRERASRVIEFLLAKIG